MTHGGVNTLAPAPDYPRYRLGDLADVPVERASLPGSVSRNSTNPNFAHHNFGRPYVYGQSAVSLRPLIRSGRLAR